MSSQKIIASQQLEIPYTLHCASCGEELAYCLSVKVTGEAFLGGSPFGRKERAENEAKEKLQKNLAYCINTFYDCCNQNPRKILKHIKQDNCPKCGQEFPWTSLLSEYKKTTGLKRLFSKKHKQEGDSIENRIKRLPHDVTPQPVLPREIIIEQLGLQGIEGESNFDTVCLFI